MEKVVIREENKVGESEMDPTFWIVRGHGKNKNVAMGLKLCQKKKKKITDAFISRKFQSDLLPYFLQAQYIIIKCKKVIWWVLITIKWTSPLKWLVDIEQ